MGTVKHVGFPAGTRRGFTLIELVIVATIIILLCTILIQSLSNAKKQAWRMECAGNLCAVGNAFNFYATELGRYPEMGDRNGMRKKAILKGKPLPPRKNNFDDFSDLAEALVYNSLGDHRALFCPTSVRTDLHSPKMEEWAGGSVSYFTLICVKYDFPDATGKPTFDATVESPHRNFGATPLNHSNARAVLVGDRTVEIKPGKVNQPGSNHGREGGWFYFTSGDAQWRSWNSLTAHPANDYIWYWPRTPTPKE